MLILAGSPRKNGNTEKLISSFSKGAEKNGHKITIYETANKNIKGCVDCKACFKNGVPCSFDDDFNQSLAHLLNEADTLVIATPLYWFSFPAKLKAAIDKFYSYIIAEKPLKIKDTALLVCGGDKDERYYEGIVSSYKSIANFMKWNDKGVILATGLHNKDDILNTEALKQAENFGESF